MTWNLWIRRSHRWLSILFVLTVGATSFAAASGQAEESWLYYLPLAPLLLLMISGLYLFALPYVSRWRQDMGSGEKPRHG